MDIVRELISTKNAQPEKVLSMSKNMNNFNQNLRVFTKENIKTIEKLTMGQSENGHWFEYRKCLLTASKAHEVVTKLTIVENDSSGTINI